MKKIGFLFDLDGVLIDSEREYTRIWKEIEMLFPTGIENFALKIKGQTLSKILDDNFPDKDVREKVTALLHEKEKGMTYSYCPGAVGILTSLRKSFKPSAVVTSSDEVKMRHLYSDLPEFRSYIDLIVDASQVTNSKPHPQGYLLAAERLGIDIRNCVVFEDSVQGVMAGQASGAFVVGITGTKSREELSPYCDTVIDGLEEIDLHSLTSILENR